MYAIRKASISDIPSLYTICLLTGDVGKDATQLYKDSDILGDIYVGPYVQYYLHLTFVLEDSEGICGYIVGSLDIVPFYHYLKTAWYPSLQKKYKRTPFDNQQSKDEHSLIERIHNPDWDILKALYEFPSELHINILPRAQGKGQGSVLMNMLFEELKKYDSAGVHLGLGIDNKKAKLFYEKIGFIHIDDKSLSPDALYMGMKW